MSMAPDSTDTIDSRVGAILAELDGLSDRALGGSAAAARGNARRVAEYLRSLAAAGEPLPRHAGKTSPGKVAVAIAKHSGASFNRQNFATNEWCGRMLDAYTDWESQTGGNALDEAIEAAEAKAPTDKRINELEREILLLRAENQHLRLELSAIRGLTARTGRLP